MTLESVQCARRPAARPGGPDHRRRRRSAGGHARRGHGSHRRRDRGAGTRHGILGVHPGRRERPIQDLGRAMRRRCGGPASGGPRDRPFVVSNTRNAAPCPDGRGDRWRGPHSPPRLKPGKERGNQKLQACADRWRCRRSRRSPGRWWRKVAWSTTMWLFSRFRPQSAIRTRDFIDRPKNGQQGVGLEPRSSPSRVLTMTVVSRPSLAVQAGQLIGRPRSPPASLRQRLMRRPALRRAPRNLSRLVDHHDCESGCPPARSSSRARSPPPPATTTFACGGNPPCGLDQLVHGRRPAPGPRSGSILPPEKKRRAAFRPEGADPGGDHHRLASITVPLGGGPSRHRSSSVRTTVDPLAQEVVGAERRACSPSRSISSACADRG